MKKNLHGQVIGKVPSRGLNLGGKHCLGGSGGSPSLALPAIKIWRWEGLGNKAAMMQLSSYWTQSGLTHADSNMYNCYILALVLAPIYVSTTKYSRVGTH